MSRAEGGGGGSEESEAEGGVEDEREEVGAYSTYINMGPLSICERCYEKIHASGVETQGRK